MEFAFGRLSLLANPPSLLDGDLGTKDFAYGSLGDTYAKSPTRGVGTQERTNSLTVGSASLRSCRSEVVTDFGELAVELRSRGGFFAAKFLCLTIQVARANSGGETGAAFLGAVTLGCVREHL